MLNKLRLAQTEKNRKARQVFRRAFLHPCGEQFALMACGSASLLRTQPGPELCRGRTPSHTCNPGRPPGNHAKPPLPSHNSPPPNPSLSKIRAAKRHTKTILSSLFPIRCVKQPLSGTQENQGDLTISRLIKRRGAFVGGTFGSLPHLSAAESRPQASACKASRQPL